MRIFSGIIRPFVSIVMLSSIIAVSSGGDYDVARQGKKIYKKIGDTVDIQLDKAIGLSDTVVWKHNSDLAIELDKGEITSYRQFKERGSVNNKTGALTIRQLTQDDSGNYTSELNNNKIKTIQLLVMYPVSKPSISKHCDEKKTYCNFTCESNTMSGAEPVDYSWRLGDVWGVSSFKEFSITQENQETLIACRVNNSVSHEVSEVILNPLISDRSHYWLLLLLLIPVALGVAFAIHKWKSGRYELALTGQLCIFCRRPGGNYDVARKEEQNDQNRQTYQDQPLEVLEAANDRPGIQETSHQNGTCVIVPETSNENGDPQTTEGNVEAATCDDPGE